jgi:hypothetical protein
VTLGPLSSRLRWTSPPWHRLRWAGPRLQTWAVTLLFVVLTLGMTWPHVLSLSTHAHGHYDTYFNMWRVGWIAHALATNPSHVLDGNIFFPERRTLTYSDAMLIEGVVGAVPLWIGLPPVLVNNLLILGAIVASAAGMFVLARHLTGSASAGIVAGIVFAFVPYRFDHYMHLELQWTIWMPWALWALHRTFETQSWKYGAAAGLFMGLQMLSSIYYGVFLAVLLGVIAVLLLLPHLREPRTLVTTTLPPLLLAPLVALAICAPYASPYMATQKEVKGREEAEIRNFSAVPASYLHVTPLNVRGKGTGRPERRLFPGLIITILAIAGLFRREDSPIPVAYLIALAIAFEISLGLSGYIYTFLYEHVSAFRGFRALARLGIFVTFFLALLGAYGYAELLSGRRKVTRGIALAIVVVLLLGEYRVRGLPLAEYPNTPPPLYAWLAQQPRGVVAELPMPRLEFWPGDDPRLTYLSTFHWKPIVNGYSGYMPQSYANRLLVTRNFPNDEALAWLRHDRVRYLVVHLYRYHPEDATLILHFLTDRHHLPELGRFSDGEGDAVVFALR